VNAPTSPISRGLCDRVLERLGFAGPPSVDVDGLRALYAAWCARVPFDNTRKMIALRTPGAPLPGTTAEDFFQEGWLREGAGGTCWPSSHALWALLCAAGFDARRVVASMRDTGYGSHGTVKVRIDDTDWLVDSSMLTNAPAPCGGAVYIDTHPIWPIEIEPVDNTHLIWFDGTKDSDVLTCRVLQDPADPEWYVAAYEASRARSPFNDRLYVRKNFPAEIRMLVGATRISRTAAGIHASALSPDELRTALHEDMGISERLVVRWVQSGSLKASFETPQPPRAPQPAGIRPSQRAG
jgi:N-hydroxyarylamine O-acetyltransferase